MASQRLPWTIFITQAGRRGLWVVNYSVPVSVNYAVCGEAGALKHGPQQP